VRNLRHSLLAIFHADRAFIYREFDNDLTLRLYRDETTEAAKVVCTVGQPYSGGWVNDRRGHAKFQTFIDASLLTVSRAGSSLHLKRRGILWACLYFADIESM